ncbi:hypothetical protein QJS04_geneDACA005676 [Acorus gramineus]|uniref:L-ascorbate oxidase n=1 Tax=Acorus gramineus TaxID=55184 RepID=A0AAV9BKA4_ACOGR|nr:hypothetical protein QJS04_geneDACA005676 [Acorus gramineus]
MMEMRRSVVLHLIYGVFVCLSLVTVRADDPYRYFTWTVTYGTIYPLGVAQQAILINGQFPGPRLDVVTNDNIILNVYNKLDEPFLLTWNGIKQRKNSWQDGVLGTNCPIPPYSNFTYKFQTKDQIGSFTYFPSTGFHRAAGGFGGLNIYARPRIPVPFSTDGDFTLLVGDWYKASHKVLRQTLDAGRSLPFPDGLLLNGRPQWSSFSGIEGRTYMFRVSNVGLSTSINFRIQGHKLLLVEIEGSHTVQNTYDSIDVHVGQSVAVWNLTSNAARPNPQGSYHYGKIPRTRTLIFANSAPLINGKRRYAVNSVSYIVPDTPLKLADLFNIPGVFSYNTLQGQPINGPAFLATSIIPSNLHDFFEIVFQNNEQTVQSWHIDGYDFWVVGFGGGQWSPASRAGYNLFDAVSRHTVQVFPNSWTSIFISLDNKGMWNIRSAMWERQYLGQQFYLRVWSPTQSFSTEYNIPSNALLCGKARGLHH